MSKWVRRAPYYVIQTDDGFIGEWIDFYRYYGKTYRRCHVSVVKPEVIHSRFERPLILADGTKDWKHKTVEEKTFVRFNRDGLLKRKTLESAQHHLEKAKENYGAKSKNRFINPRIVYVENPKKFFDNYVEFIKGPKPDYNEWNW